ncbi:MAG: IS66 family insertion sequence element accessory protein TnpB, partial [Proteobacteria bacterium]|nr:IS66 family insertion sequence element accessory protein TnpB [Pseudomonadota bacterium]
DMRRGMNSLALQIQQALGRDPHGGDLYVFGGRRRWRSTHRQRTTPSRPKSAPCSTHAVASACCWADRRGRGPLRRG